MVVDKQAKATLLNEYFPSVFAKDDGDCPSFSRRVSCDVSLENIEFTPKINHLSTLMVFLLHFLRS